MSPHSADSSRWNSTCVSGLKKNHPWEKDCSGKCVPLSLQPAQETARGVRGEPELGALCTCRGCVQKGPRGPPCRHQCACAQVSPARLGPVGRGSEGLRPTARLANVQGARAGAPGSPCMCVCPRSAGACRHMHAAHAAQHSPGLEPPGGHPGRAPPGAPSGAAGAAWRAPLRGRGPGQGGVGKAWGRLPPSARVSLPFKTPARGGGGCRGSPANGSRVPRGLGDVRQSE